MDEPTSPPVVGWCERIDFPEWDLRRVRAKIDTGARTSALGVLYYVVTDLPGEGLVADLTVATNHSGRPATVRAKYLGMVQVRNSCGENQDRPLVEARVRLGPVTEILQFTVTDRSKMRFPVILGRTALRGRFVVDVGRKYLWKRPKGQRPKRA